MGVYDGLIINSESLGDVGKGWGCTCGLGARTSELDKIPSQEGYQTILPSGTVPGDPPNLLTPPLPGPIGSLYMCII